MNTQTETANDRVTVEHINLDVDWDHRAALASIRLGQVVRRGISIWRQPRTGRLRVYFPRYQWGERMYDEAIELPPDLRAEVEASVLAAYHEAKKAEKAKTARRLRKTQQRGSGPCDVSSSPPTESN